MASRIMGVFSSHFKDEGSFSKHHEYYDFNEIACLKFNFLKNFRYFEKLSIKILDLFDKNESDFFNDNLLLTRNPHFTVHILQFANNAGREKFMATNCAQKVLDEIWNNGILFSQNKKIFFQRGFLRVSIN